MIKICFYKAQRAYIFVVMPKDVSSDPAGRYLYSINTGPLGRVLNLIRQSYKDIGPLGL